MDVISIPIADLVEDPANVRSHSDRNLEAIKASLQRFGQQKPIVVDANNVIRAGNGTFRAAKLLKWDSIDCVRSELGDAEAIAYAIADNRTTDMSAFDSEALMRQLDGLDYELVNCAGYTDDELNALRDSLDAPAETPESGRSEIAETFQVIVECDNEGSQKALYERLAGEGYQVKSLQV